MIYLSGPITSTSFLGVHRNTEIAREYAIKIWNAGAGCFCPHLNTQYFHELSYAKYEQYMEFDLRILESMDAVFMIPGWQQSKGACKEHEKAVELGLTILYSEIELMDYVRKNDI